MLTGYLISDILVLLSIVSRSKWNFVQNSSNLNFRLQTKPARLIFITFSESIGVRAEMCNEYNNFILK